MFTDTTSYPVVVSNVFNSCIVIDVRVQSNFKLEPLELEEKEKKNRRQAEDT